MVGVLIEGLAPARGDQPLVALLHELRMIVFDQVGKRYRSWRGREVLALEDFSLEIAAGEVLEQDGDCYGPVVNRAARFVQSAPDGSGPWPRCVERAQCVRS